MSNVGQAVLVIGGTIVGSFFGNPQLGFLLGNLAGQALFPTDLGTVSGPKLDDLSVTSSALGAPIPLVYGTYAIAGNIIWSTDLIPTTTSERVGGKGGPTQRVETTTYAVNFAVGLCEGPIAGIRRIWAGGKLIYDRRPQLDGEDNAAYAARLTAADAFDTGMAVYLGTEDQDPDPTIEAWEGVGNVPAYRGLAYVVFTDFQLADYGNNLAATALRFEVVTLGGPLCAEEVEYSTRVVYPWLESYAQPLNSRNLHFASATYTRGRSGSGSVGSGDIGPAVNPVTEALQIVRDLSGLPELFFVAGAASPPGTNNESVGANSTDVTGNAYPIQGASVVWQYYFPVMPDIYASVDDVLPFSGTPAAFMALFGVNVGEVIYLDVGTLATGITVPGDLTLSSGLPFGTPFIARRFNTIAEGAADPLWGTFGEGYDEQTDSAAWRFINSVRVKIRRAARFPDDPCLPQGLPPYPDHPFLKGFCLIGGEAVEGGGWTEQDAGFGGMFARVLARHGTGFPTITLNSYDWITAGWRMDGDVGPLVVGTDPNFESQSFWEARYAEAVAAGLMAPGLAYGFDYPTFPTAQKYYTRTFNRCALIGGPTLVGQVVEDLCERAGLTPEQIDVSDLPQPIEGYAIGRIVNAADGIQPLRPYAFFDCVESGGLLRFVTRGKPAVETLTVDDLGAHPSGEGAPPAVKVTRTMDVELPRVLWVRYAMLEKDYEPDAQPSSRLRTTANQTVNIELPIAMSTAKAAQLAEINLYEAWAARNAYEIDLGNEFLKLEPTDTINVPVDGGLERIRIVAEEYRVPGVKRLQALRDDPTVYFSYATGSQPLKPGQTVTVLDDSVAEYLDLPALRDVDDDAGYYAALRQSGSNSWPGASVLRSPDGGASFNTVGAATAQAVTGQLNAALPAGPSTIFDEGNELLVTLDRGALESVTDAALDGGANAAAIGAHGRWEVIQFRTATLVSGSQWRLTGLLRGRRGTEHAIGQSQAGDRFVLLDAAIRLTQDVAAIGVVRPHRAVTFGRPLDSGNTVNFAGDGEALRPYAPVHLAGARDAAGDLTLTWIRRGRIGRELASGADIPLSEEIESYDVEVLNGTTVVRTLTSNSPTVTYTAVQQATDFGSQQSQVTVRIYQRSATVGRGYPLEGTV